MKDCPNSDFQGRQIELDGNQPWAYLEQLLTAAGLEGFFCSIGNDQCNNENIYNGATVKFSFSTRGGAKVGDWEVNALTQAIVQDHRLKEKLLDWIAETWLLPVAELEDFLTTPQTMENLSTIMQFPMLTGQYFIIEGENGARRGIMPEYLREDKNEFTFLCGDKGRKKQTKIYTIQAASKNWKSSTNETRRKDLREQFIQLVCQYEVKKKELIQITEGHWSPSVRLTSVELSKQYWHFAAQSHPLIQETQLQKIMEEAWQSDIFQALIRFRETPVYLRARTETFEGSL
jgi:hypothetical protein